MVPKGIILKTRRNIENIEAQLLRNYDWIDCTTLKQETKSGPKQKTHKKLTYLM